MSQDVVNHPPHYTFSRVEVIDAIEAWDLGFHLSQVIKYVARSRHKGQELTDLKKARWYLERRIAQLEPAQAPVPINYPYLTGVPLGALRCPHLFSPNAERPVLRCTLNEGHEGDHVWGPQ